MLKEIKISNNDLSIKKNFNKITKNELELESYKKWTRSHGGNHNLKFADYSEIILNSINNLKIKWTYKEKGNVFSGVQMNPVYKDNVLYIATGNGKILKTFKMEAAGSSPPIIYKDKDGEKITVITGSMNYTGFDTNSPTQIYTFSIN